MATKQNEQTKVIGAVLVIVGLAGLAFLFFQSPLAHQGDMTEPTKVKPSITELKEGNSRQINEDKPGEELNIADHKVSGHFTIFDFYSEHCGPCMRIAPELVELTKQRPDIAVRSLDVDRPGTQGIDWESPLCSQYNIHSLPHFIIMNASGKTIAQGRSASEKIIKLIQKANYE
ncbi:MAG: thioredoxin family protein [Candidatus Obscuribacterales bacterium]|nr:thioredoxin family protein [Candidatus Obscuribacterales bacterium]